MSNEKFVSINLILDLVPEGSQNAVPTLSPLSDLTVPEGSPARFVTSFTGFPSPQITWMREGNVLRPSADFEVR